MHISKFRIQNFKSFEDVTLHFNESVNLFTGANNTGKSTILEAISLWCECYSNRIDRAKTGFKDKFKTGNYFFGAKVNKDQYVPYQDILSVRSPNYDDIFYNLGGGAAGKNADKVIVLTATLCQDAAEFDIALAIQASDGGTYKWGLADSDGFNIPEFNTFLGNNDALTLIGLIYASPVASLTPTEEQHTRNKVNYLKKSRASIGVLRNRLFLLRDKDRGESLASLAQALSIILTDNKFIVKFTFEEDKHKLLSIVNLEIGKDTPKDISLYGSGTLQIIEILLALYEDKTTMNLVLLDEPDSHIHRDMQNRLLRRLENTDVQIFLTSHNDALIRSTKPEFTFHLSAVRQRQYRPISLDPETFKKRGLYPSPHAKILSDLGGNNSLDFVHALESDILFIVEGINDAIRLPQIVPRVADKSAFWVIDGVDEIFKNLHGIKRIFENIKNEKSLWDKAILVFDKDKMTDKHRLLLMDKFENESGKKGAKKLGIKTYIFESANFESVLLSEPVVLARLLRLYISKLTTVQDPIVSEQTLLAQIIDTIAALQTTLKDELKLKEKEYIYKLKDRREKCKNCLDIIGIFDNDDILMTKDFQSYCEKILETPSDFHKITSKEQVEVVITTVLNQYSVDFISFEVLLGLMDVLTQFQQYKTINDLAKTISN